MNESRIEAALHKLDERFDRIEQILPTLLTKDESARFATKDDFAGFATKDDLAGFATTVDLQDLRGEVRAEAEATRRHFDAVAEDFMSQVKLVSEGHQLIAERSERELEGVRADVRAIDRRVMRLEADKLRR